MPSRCVCLFFFQAEDGIRDLVRSRGLGDVYKRQAHDRVDRLLAGAGLPRKVGGATVAPVAVQDRAQVLSLIHI